MRAQKTFPLNSRYFSYCPRSIFLMGMKKNMKGFKKDYGKDAKSVMYATATKMAKEKK